MPVNHDGDFCTKKTKPQSLFLLHCMSDDGFQLSDGSPRGTSMDKKRQSNEELLKNAHKSASKGL